MERNRSDQSQFPQGLLAPRQAGQAGQHGVRWYVAHVPAGREEAFAAKCRQIISSDVLEDCFFPKAEKFLKRRGAWLVEEAPLFSEYCFLATNDVQALAKQLRELSFPVVLVGRAGNSFAPLDPQAQKWLSSALDSQHVLRASWGVIEDGKLSVRRGPLRGREADVRRIDRHKRTAYVGLCGQDGSCGFQLRAGLEVPAKS